MEDVKALMSKFDKVELDYENNNEALDSEEYVRLARQAK